MALTANHGKARPRERLLEAFQRRGGVLTRGDIAGLGFGSDTLQQLLRDSTVVRAAHGIYRLADTVPFGTAAFAQACLAIPSAIVALQSALSYYELTTQIVAEVEVAVPRRVPRKRIEIPLRCIPMPLSRFTWEIDQIRSEEGDRFRIFSAERTVCDCFAYPAIVPESVAYEGLRAYLERSNVDVSKLMEQAEFTKTDRIIGPVVKTRLS